MFVYKLAGRRSYLEFDIDGKQELVFELEPWYNLLGDKPKNYQIVINNLKKEFTRSETPVRYIRFPDGYNIYRVDHEDFTHATEDSLISGFYPAVDQKLVK